LGIASLNTGDINTFSSITNPGRRLEWLAVRALLRQFYPTSPTIDYHENGKPLLVNHTDKISISHSATMVAVVLHPNRIPGIDIEIIHSRIIKIANRFLGDKERSYTDAAASLEQLTIIWGAKEVMFKVYENGGVTFKNDFVVNPFASSMKGNLEGIIQKDNTNITIPMEYMKIGNFILVQTDYTGDFGKNADL
jgi:phosphopantetheinyl transferase